MDWKIDKLLWTRASSQKSNGLTTSLVSLS